MKFPSLVLPIAFVQFMRMTDRPVVLVTGASKGIGAATALAFAKAGYDVCVNYHRDAPGAAETVARCEATGARAFVARADVADRSAVSEMFGACDELLGPVTCLVNNAGIIGGTAAVTEVSNDALRGTFATNVFGMIYCLQEAALRMRTDQGGAGGAIVNMSSVAATTGSPGEYVHYAASKGAVETLTIGAGKELGPVGIRVAAIRVGTTNTDLHAREGNATRPAAVAAATPLGRTAESVDIAEAAVWLASPKAGFVSGTVLTVAGGLHA
ncbi:NAD(P)-dependent dehydrogenase, short-chain alcohol dehydrogenase family [Tranquillimonas alkanivorans]|uniref:NAD(P)-dependent dehydrogenase, short-chain alcohol dehydrogenase family n=2 Tax=Tranquillimonas alkanivorans TaxID=441119 RepID=A0A1I5VZQ3_9RHOB|nr:NAD(P)-dependent dehydrogenase, short-chain alcohol dehydrogenase family [Tranquillimonas alkanivorans]